MNGLTISVSIGSVPTLKQDKEMAKELADSHNLTSGDVTAAKRIFPKGYWGKVQTSQQGIRQYLYDISLPWGDGGERIISCEGYRDNIGKLEEMVNDYHRTLEETLEGDPSQGIPSYDEVVSSRRVGVFATTNFPGKETLKERLQARINIGEPQGSDWRTRLTQSEVDQIQFQIEKTHEARLAETTQENFSRLKNILEKMVDRLGAVDQVNPETGRKGHFADKMFDSAREMVSFLRRMNLTGDQDLEFSVTQMEKALQGVNPDVLRVDDTLRRKKMEQLKAIYEIAGKEMSAGA